MDTFFEFNKEFLQKLPNSIIDTKDNFDRNSVIEAYLDIFSKKLYELT